MYREKDGNFKLIHAVVFFHHCMRYVNGLGAYRITVSLNCESNESRHEMSSGIQQIQDI